MPELLLLMGFRPGNPRSDGHSLAQVSGPAALNMASMNMMGILPRPAGAGAGLSGLARARAWKNSFHQLRVKCPDLFRWKSAPAGAGSRGRTGPLRTRMSASSMGRMQLP